jgi:hypothetical protein
MRWTRAAPRTRALLPPSLMLRRTGSQPGEAFGADGSRTAKSCGPDAPTLASSRRDFFRRRQRQTSPVAGESTKETVKTIARGMPDVSGATVVTNACAFYHCARGCGRAERPAFPAPSAIGGTRFMPILRPGISRAAWSGVLRRCRNNWRRIFRGTAAARTNCPTRRW